MATTRIMSIHINKGKTARQCITERLDYIMNPEKTDGGILISSYACEPQTAADEFMLYRQEYLEKTGREIENEILGYHVRQAFKPGEITPEDANAIGKELAERISGGHHAFVVATHIDKHHVHNHIIFCSTDLDGRHKYRDVKCSAKDLAQLSDALCQEHSLSVIRDPQDKTLTYDKWQGNQKKTTHRDDLRMMIDAALRFRPDGFDALMQLLEDAGCLIKRGAHIAIKPPAGERYIRLDSLGPEYDEASLRRALSGDHVHIPKIPRGDYTESQVKRLVDIEAKLRAGKGKGYQVWAERNNIDAKAQMVIFLKEHQIGSLEELDDQILDLHNQQKNLKSSLREKQNRQKEINRQREAIRNYSRTKEVYTQFQESGWSQKFYQEHREEIEKHTTMEGNKLDVELDDNMNKFEKLAVRAFDFAGNFSDPISLDNPDYVKPVDPTPEPTATPKPSKKPSSGSTATDAPASDAPVTGPTPVVTALVIEPVVTEKPHGLGSSLIYISDDDWMEPTQAPTAVPTAEPTAAPTPEPIIQTEYITIGPGMPYQADGNSHTLDVLYSAATNKQFITLQSKAGNTFYLVIDYDKPIDEEAEMYETYFLNLVDERDLLALMSDEEKEEVPTPTPEIIYVTPEPTAVPAPTPVVTEPEPEKKSDQMMAIIALAAIVLLGGGAAVFLQKNKGKGGKSRADNDFVLDDDDEETDEEESSQE